jgi:hypothetical protein
MLAPCLPAALLALAPLAPLAAATAPGAVVRAQAWFRDPFNTSNRTTALSDALAVQVQP